MLQLSFCLHLYLTEYQSAQFEHENSAVLHILLSVSRVINKTFKNLNLCFKRFQSFNTLFKRQFVIYIYIYVCVCVCVFVFLYVCICVCKCLRGYVCTCACMCVCKRGCYESLNQFVCQKPTKPPIRKEQAVKVTFKPEKKSTTIPNVIHKPFSIQHYQSTLPQFCYHFPLPYLLPTLTLPSAQPSGRRLDNNHRP